MTGANISDRQNAVTVREIQSFILIIQIIMSHVRRLGKMTNLDQLKAKIANMDSTELAKVLSGSESCGYCGEPFFNSETCIELETCIKQIVVWLEQEAKE